MAANIPIRICCELIEVAMVTKVSPEMLEQPVIIGAARRGTTTILDFSMSDGSTTSVDILDLISRAMGNYSSALDQLIQSILLAPVVNPAGTPKSGDIKVASGKAYVYATSEWVQVWPPAFA